MMRHTPPFLALCLLLLSAALPVRSRAAKPQHQPLAVVVNHATVMTDISLAELRRVFRGGVTTAPDGKRLLPLNCPLGTYERELFDRRVLGLEPEDVARFWINLRIRDEAQPPRTLPSCELGVRVVASYPGAIGYVSAHMAGSGVRVLKVDGKTFSEPGYLLAAP